MMFAWFILFWPSHSSRVLIGVGLVGGNPTVNTNNTITLPGFVGGGDSFSALLQVYFLFGNCSRGTPISIFCL